MGSDEVHWVNSETFFDQLPEVLATVSGCRVRRRSMPRSRRCWTPPGQTRRSSATPSELTIEYLGSSTDGQLVFFTDGSTYVGDWEFELNRTTGQLRVISRDNQGNALALSSGGIPGSESFISPSGKFVLMEGAAAPGDSASTSEEWLYDTATGNITQLDLPASWGPVGPLYGQPVTDSGDVFWWGDYGVNDDSRLVDGKVTFSQLSPPSAENYRYLATTDNGQYWVEESNTGEIGGSKCVQPLLYEVDDKTKIRYPLCLTDWAEDFDYLSGGLAVDRDWYGLYFRLP